MNSDRIPVSSDFTRRLAQLGVGVPRLLRYVGLPVDLLDTDGARVSTDQFFALWEALEQFAKDPAFSLRMVAGFEAGSSDVAAMVATHAATFGEALEKLGRYKRIVCPEVVGIDVEGELARLTFDWPLANRRTPLLLVDVCFASVVSLARRGLDEEVAPLRVLLDRSGAGQAGLQEFFGCEVVFDAGEDVLVFDSELLDRPFITSEPNCLSRLLPGRPEPAELPMFVARVRRQIVEQMQGDRPNVDAVAHALSMSGRSLQRKLVELGFSYQRLLDDARHQYAVRLLAETALDITEVAYLLGFQEVNSLVRAFVSWEGYTPTRWRKCASLERGRRPASASPSQASG